MVLNIPPQEWKELSYSKRRKLINKEKKHRVRVANAKQRQLEQMEYDKYLQTDEGREMLKSIEKGQQKEEAERQLRHEEWLQKEKKAQDEFRQKRETEEKRAREKEEREKMIREEWEAIERRERDTKSKKEQAKQSKEALLEEALADIDERLQMDTNDIKEQLIPWHNPFAPVDNSHQSGTAALDGLVKELTVLEEVLEPLKNYGTEKDKVNCPFYLKTGACRYGDHCSRHHAIPQTSPTLLIRSMYNHPLLSHQYPDDQDAGLEIDESDMLEDFKEFYNDVMPELAECGKIVQFKVSRNYEPHLRGNVYVQFSKENECTAAVKVFNGRWYAGRQLCCEFSPVQKWKTAICGLYDRQECPRGKQCNFLHVFENPGGAFAIDVGGGHSGGRTTPTRGRYHRRWQSEGGNRGRRSPSPSRNWRGYGRQNSGDRYRRYSPSARGRRDRRRSVSAGRSRSRSPRRRSPRRSRSRSPRRRYQRERLYSSSPDDQRRSSKRHRRTERSVSNSSEEYSSRSTSPMKRRHSGDRRHKKKRKHKSKQHKRHKKHKHSKYYTSSESDNEINVDKALRDVTAD